MDDGRLRHIQGAIRTDLLYLMLHERLGDGMSREVYVFRPDPTKVIKLETGSHFQNVNEQRIWEHNEKCPKVSRWLAPVRWISGYGSVLIMDKTEPIPLKYYPKELPIWLWDLKKENFGFYKGRIVCHDYGTLHDVSSMRMKKVKWDK